MMIKMSASHVRKTLNNIPKNYFTLSHIDQIKKRDDELVNKVLSSDKYSASEFSNFMRVVSNQKGNEIMISRFTSELPKHVNYLNDLDTRKSISIVLSNHSLHSDTKLIGLLKERFNEIKKAKGIKDEGEVKIGCDWKKFDLSIRFWVGYARFRERFYASIRKTFKLNLQ